MNRHRRFIAVCLWILLLPALALNCRVWSALPARPAVAGATQMATGVDTAADTLEPTALPLPTFTPTPTPIVDTRIPAGEPAGCLSADAQAAFASPQQMLAYADELLGLDEPLAKRQEPLVWNAYTGHKYSPEKGALGLLVDKVQKEYLLQDMLDALQVAGFVTWLRHNLDGKLEILAIPLTPAPQPDSPWTPYVAAYWQDRFSTPAEDPTVIPALKLPPCAWAVDQGTAPALDSGWWNSSAGWPDYAWAAEVYLAADTKSANQVARAIDWLGSDGLESPNTMCGPLAWSILNHAGAFPPGVGGWSWGSKTFWLAKPTTNGRPWSLFPPDTYQVVHISQPLSAYDFSSSPLYPGDFLYTYSKKDGFDHMLVVTEKDSDGNVYTVTNLVKVYPEKKLTIERAVLYNESDRSIGLARNEWAKDMKNGRTGHDGFDVFRWTWMVKDITGQPAAYIVQAGDTLGLVAERWKTPASLIARYNGLELDAALSVGQVLQIPPNEMSHH
jgi:hypothetical protein